MGQLSRVNPLPLRVVSSTGGDIAVVAFGGNAILRAGQRGTAREQLNNLAEMARHLATMIQANWRVVVTHGNGPQVGNIRLQQEAGEPEIPGMSFDVCGAMSQGQIGYLLETALSQEFARRGIDYPTAAILTRCVVDPADPAFSHPTKPVGPFYDRTDADALAAERDWTMVQDAGRGYRRAVPSPRPHQILEVETVRLLVKAGIVVVACGGGGVPVLADGRGGYVGAEAVIDKDHTASLLAQELKATALVLLTQVPEVMVHFGTAKQRGIADASLQEIESLSKQGHFLAGSMGPKIEAAASFLRGGGRVAVITSPDLLMDALSGSAGTRVWRGPSQPYTRSGLRAVNER